MISVLGVVVVVDLIILERGLVAAQTLVGET
jgi:hypothetical protein